MIDASLQRVDAFHTDVCALLEAGLPIDIGIEGSPREIEQKLGTIRAALKAAVERDHGKTIAQAIEGEPTLPSRYRAALRTWLRSDNPSIALDGISDPAESRQSFCHHLTGIIVYPAIVVSLTYVACLYLCFFTVPKIESIYGQLSKAPSASLGVLMKISDWMPIWVPGVPLVLVVLAIGWRLSASRMSWQWVPGRTRYLRTLQDANMANQLASLVQSGSTLERSLELVGAQAGRPGPKDGRATIDSFPPLLRWAVEGDLGDEPLAGVLRFVAQTYQQKARRQRTLWRVVAPTLCGVVVGGVVVLAYGLGLFMPVVQLLKDVSLPGGA